MTVTEEAAAWSNLQSLCDQYNQNIYDQEKSAFMYRNLSSCYYFLERGIDDKGDPIKYPLAYENAAIEDVERDWNESPSNPRNY